jgi:NAD(P)-dependent dehydrogenase (short-subunit alcohol dehydrogenase family)
MESGPASRPFQLRRQSEGETAMKRLDGKVAVITGGNSGIGLASAKAFINEGAHVVIAGRDQKTLNDAASELGSKALPVRADVSKLSDLDKLYQKTKERFGKIDVLFANAGIAQFAPFDKITEEFFDTTFDVNTKGLYFTVQKAVPFLTKGASVILTTSSVVEKGMPGASVYAASKAAVRSLARSFSAELAERGIRVNVLCPGPVDTPIIGRMGLSPEAVKGMRESMQARVPLKRFGHSDELAKVALFLASDDSSFMLGAEVAVDGGVGQL